MKQRIQVAVILGGLLMAGAAWGQTFSSLSTGADGAYNPTVSGDFDPTALGINAAADNVFNFTTINIPAGVTIKLKASKVRNAPVIWLATGNVTIAGTLSLDGATPVALDASNASQLAANRIYPDPGPGGYTGGLGSKSGVGPDKGAGPGGGQGGATTSVQTCNGSGGAFYSSGAGGPYGQASTASYGSPYMIPLYGGSGGGGGWATAANVAALGGTGGAGGGAIRIVSTTQISVAGTISAAGGNSGLVTSSVGCDGGPGAGGAIHLISPTIVGAGTITTNSGLFLYGNSNYGGVPNGGIRFGVTNNNFTGTKTGNFLLGPLYNVPNNSTLALPTLLISQVNGITVPNPPQGQYLAPDITINSNTPVTVNLAGANIPLGTVATLRITAETGGDQQIACSALAGAVASSTATCSATFPFSISIAGARATW